MSFFDTNVAEGLPANHRFQVGRADFDADAIIEQTVLMPQFPAPKASYLYYECTIGAILDNGIVIHNRLPQTLSPTADTLAYRALDDPSLDGLTAAGVNLTCKDQYLDIIQRMGHSRYWFRLWGRALRVGYQVPIPGIKKIAGVEAIPYDKNPQWAYNTIAPGGNYSGAILWLAEWSLWYTTQLPPGQTSDGESILIANPAARISGNNKSTPPAGNVLRPPYSRSDDNAIV